MVFHFSAMGNSAVRLDSVVRASLPIHLRSLEVKTGATPIPGFDHLSNHKTGGQWLANFPDQPVTNPLSGHFMHQFPLLPIAKNALSGFCQNTENGQSRAFAYSCFSFGVSTYENKKVL